MKIILASLALALTVWAAGAQEHTSMDNQTADGYRGIWFTIGQARSAYGAKYSGGLGTYTMKHIPMAVYAPTRTERPTTRSRTRGTRQVPTTATGISRARSSPTRQ